MLKNIIRRGEILNIMKNINLLPSNHKEKFYLYTCLKKALTIIVGAFFILILIVFLLDLTFSYLENQNSFMQSNINNDKYINSEIAFHEKNFFIETNLTLTNIINAIGIDDYTYSNVLNNINNCFDSKNIFIEDLLFDILSKKITLKLYTENKKYIFPIVVKLNELEEVQETNVIHIKNENKSVVTTTLEIILY